MLIPIYEYKLLEMQRRMIETPENYPRKAPEGPRYFGDTSYVVIVDELLFIDIVKERYKENDEWKLLSVSEVRDRLGR